MPRAKLIVPRSDAELKARDVEYNRKARIVARDRKQAAIEGRPTLYPSRKIESTEALKERRRIWKATYAAKKMMRNPITPNLPVVEEIESATSVIATNENLLAI